MYRHKNILFKSLILLLFLAPLIPSSWADDPSGFPSFSAFNPSSVRPFNPSITAAANFASFAPCAASTLSDLGGAILKGKTAKERAKLAGQGSIFGASCGEGSFTEIKSSSCEQVKVAGKYDPKRTKKLEEEIDKAVQVAECKQLKLESVNKNLACLDSRAKALQTFIDSTKATIDSVINDAKQKQSEIQNLEDSRNDQVTFLSERLNEMETLKRDALPYITQGLSQQIKGLELALRNGIENQKKVIEELRIAEKARITAACFNFDVKRSDFVCQKGQAPVSAKDYLLCRVGQNSFKGKNNRIEKSARREQQSSANQKQLNAILASIFNDLPFEQQITNPQTGQIQGVVSKANRITSVEDINRIYGTQLANMSVPGFDIKGFVLGMYKACNNQAARDVAVLESKPGERIFLAKEQLKSNQVEFQTSVENFITESTDKFSSVQKVFDQFQLDQDPNACRTMAPADQINCLKGVKQKMTDLVLGTGTNSIQQIAIPGTVPQHQGQVVCSGINGCIKEMDRFRKLAVTDVKRIKQAKKSFIVGTNKNLQDTFNQLRNQAKLQLTGLESYMAQLNTTLTSLGIGDQIELKERQGENVKIDPDQIMDSPNDLGRVLGLPDLAGGNIFGKAKASVASKKVKLEKEVADAKNAKAEIADLAYRCQEEEGKKLFEAAEAVMKRYDEAKCGFKKDSEDSSFLSELVKSMRNISEIPGGGDPSVLVAGIDPQNKKGELDRYNEFVQLDNDTKRDVEIAEKRYNQAADEYNSGITNSNLTQAQKDELEKLYKLAKDKFESAKTTRTTKIDEYAKRFKFKQDIATTDCSAIFRDLQKKFGDIKDFDKRNNSSASARSRS